MACQLLLPYRNIRLAIVLELQGVGRVNAPGPEGNGLACRDGRDLGHKGVVLAAAAEVEGQFNVTKLFVTVIFQLSDHRVLDG